VGERRKGVMIALPRKLDETSLIHGRLIQMARLSVALKWYGAGYPGIVPG